MAYIFKSSAELQITLVPGFVLKETFDAACVASNYAMAQQTSTETQLYQYK
jgi:hypothetical protein